LSPQGSTRLAPVTSGWTSPTREARAIASRSCFTTDSQTFAAWYLFSHGVIKLVLVVAVLTNQVWAYPAFIVAMIGFILYQVYRMTFDVTFIMVAITVLDLIVLFLAWHEYSLLRRQRQHSSDADP
jgi:uncharacterized membrane protein